jgi:hypothetical protein
MEQAQTTTNVNVPTLSAMDLRTNTNPSNIDQTTANVNVPTLLPMDLQQWERMENQHPSNDEKQNKSSFLKDCDDDETIEVHDDCFLSETFVDINNPDTIDLRQYPHGAVSFWTTSLIHEFAWATVSYSQTARKTTKTYYKKCVGCWDCPVDGCLFTKRPKLGKKQRTKQTCRLWTTYHARFTIRRWNIIAVTSKLL